MNDNKKKPEWAPKNYGEEFASNILSGINKIVTDNKLMEKDTIKKVTDLSIEDFVDGVLEGNRSILSRTITLIESNSPKHIEKAQKVLKALLPHTGKSIRIGITGAPGVGKSSLIESLGSYLCEQNYEVAVLAIDPSSSISKGSILGDKTRMENLSRFPNAFIRPSPSGGTLGGVTRKTRESILLCEASGFDVILIETIGVGQSEITVRSIVDFFLLMILPGGGDELQGIKKGSVELADLLVINKADGDNLNNAKITMQSYADSLHYLIPATEGWQTKVLLSSAVNDIGIKEIWNQIQDFIKITKETKQFDKRRSTQLLKWVYSLVEENLLSRFYENKNIKNIQSEIEESVLKGTLTPTSAVNKLLNIFEK